ncbi:DUF1837 domain-containing protein [Rhodopseudomonas boonkerdii]|uniref:HamA C-terminal domain-containing protein n=1 Tax=Rhodopseudomonas boonkerdii TaxID=475937 RepID=UPI001E639A2C|nr:DUF1837 domain-containing protein [Rhodopseudomonas boonkerdii]UGV27730.1 DUF1837 domain-containing protein [Rhodopseudomonas boonkerdii]
MDAITPNDIEGFVAALRRDYDKLSIRIRELMHSVTCDCEEITLHLHFPAIAQGRATIWEAVNVLLDYLTPFALHRSQIQEVLDQYGKISAEQYRIECERLQREACSTFIQAQRAANKNGEAGELLLFILTEWILKAPQLLAKLPLKTNRNVPIFGSDGIHVGFWREKNVLCTYWGEAKLHADLGKAINSAIDSIKNSLRPQSSEFELALVRRNLDTTGLDKQAKAALLSFLNPLNNENYNSRIDITTCLISFDFDAYSKLNSENGENHFRSLALQHLQKLAPKLSTALSAAGIKNRHIELFLFPVPSVQDFRDQFQMKIGWNDDTRSS